MSGGYEAMSKEDLVAALRRLEATRDAGRGDETSRLVHDLEVHQHELEMQNRELREAQGLLEESRNRYSELYDFAPTAYLTLDRKGRVIEANLTAAALFGLERAHLAGRLLTMLVPRADRTRLSGHLRQCTGEGRRAVTELNVLDRGKRPVAVQLTSMPIVTPGGVVTGCRTALTDVSELRRTQDQLRFVANAGVTLASSLDPVQPLREVAVLAVPLIADLCLIHVAQSDGSLERIAAGVAAERRAILSPTLRFVPSTSETRKKNAVVRALETGEAVLLPEAPPAVRDLVLGAFERETFGRVEDLRSLIVVPLVSRAGVNGLLTLATLDSGRTYSEADVGMARDFATRIAMSIENARLYQDARRATVARQDLLSFVSHDLRSPLMGMLLSVEAMLKMAPPVDRRSSAKPLDRVRRAILQMGRMIDDLLDVATLEAGHFSVRIGDYDTADLLEEAREMLTPIAIEKRLAVEVQPPQDPCRVRCDRERILQVFSNLVGNAIKFTPAEGRVSIKAERSGGGVRIVIRDTGPGIPPNLLPHIFERYWQADKLGRKGTGLGLYIAKGIVESQGGTIWAESADGAGATFCFTLPLVPPPEMDRLVETMRPRRGPIGKNPIVHSG